MRVRGIHPLSVLSGALVALAAAPPLFAQAPGGGNGEGGDVYETARHSFRIVTVADGLDRPWSMAWLPNGDMLVTEKPGRLRIVRNGRLDPEPIAGTPTVRAMGQGGLLEVLPHPDFASNRLLYLSYSKPNADASEATTAVARGRLEGNRITGLEDIFVAKAWAQGNAHFAGRMVFDRDGYLFLSVGDRGAAPDLMADHPAQDPSNHQGTILRFHDDGSVPDDNPYVASPGFLPEIWSWGHRNPQGLALDPETGELWSNEHGPRGGDEVNRILPGRNYGWPVVSHGINYDGSIYTRITDEEGYEAPRYTWVPSIATSGMTVYGGDRFPWWKGSLFVGGMGDELISRLSVYKGRVVSEEKVLEGVLGRIRDVRQGPDGYLYLATEDRRGATMTPIVRLEPAAGPVALPR